MSNSEHQKQRIERCKSNGMCVICNKNRATKGTIKCQECNDTAKHKNKKWRKTCKDIGKCQICGGNVLPGKVTCVSCLENRRMLYNERKSQGVCVKCGKTAICGKTQCITCHASTGRARQIIINHRIENGICSKCGKHSAFPSKKFCVKCLVASQARLAKTTLKILLEVFEEQKGQCPYTGRHLILGGDASVDHKLPRSKGGTNNKPNLQWVHYNVNVAKLNMTHDEFITFCREIVEYQSSALS